MRIVVLILALCLPTTATLAADFDQAITDYRTENYAAAFAGFKAAALEGDHVAQFNVGVMFYRGQGVASDLVQAYGWIDLATEGGDVDMIRAQGYLVLDMTQEQIDQGRRLAAQVARQHGLAYVDHRLSNASLAIVDRR